MISNELPQENLDPSLIYFICHEFKNPLFAFKTILQQIKLGNLPDTDSIDEVVLECKHFEKFLDAVLENPRTLTLDDLQTLKRASQNP